MKHQAGGAKVGHTFIIHSWHVLPTRQDCKPCDVIKACPDSFKLLLVLYSLKVLNVLLKKDNMQILINVKMQQSSRTVVTVSIFINMYAPRFCNCILSVLTLQLAGPVCGFGRSVIYSFSFKPAFKQFIYTLSF